MRVALADVDGPLVPGATANERRVAHALWRQQLQKPRWHCGLRAVVVLWTPRYRQQRPQLDKAE